MDANHFLRDLEHFAAWHTKQLKDNLLQATVLFSAVLILLFAGMKPSHI
jgi:hypothetical protein